ncbi:MAG: sensor histidine kinase [Aliiglaciecola sp.]|uniref:sensor histidine kinase n=1 Tax=Aliiglaciecola sp. M165 TaxID=2593649 RepID=UPI00117CE4C6|nr:sensor histidine kinase [Aliiglaciecola sp. M165]TRY31859.1 sensor histidine kinase [Aliiglaciecola sp. M165]
MDVKHLVNKYISIESLTAVMAWAVVSISAVWLMYDSNDYSWTSIAAAVTFFVIFKLSFLASIVEHDALENIQVSISLLVVQYIAIMAAAAVVPFTYIAILVTIWSAQLPYFVSFRTAVISSPLWSAPLWIVFSVAWGREFNGLSALLFWTFNMFALVMVNATIREKRAREAANEINRELLATQALLGEAAKQAERVRISRNIHDLLGHHLTALTIKLQVAARITDGEAQKNIQQCHDLSKLLLSDVREAVSEIREKSAIEWQFALRQLIENVPNLTIDLDIKRSIQISDMHTADAILKCVQECLTNTLKHSDAKHFSISIDQIDNNLLVEMSDDGHHKKSKTLTEGNGLKGMRERIKELGGNFIANLSPNGFKTVIELPEVL